MTPEEEKRLEKNLAECPLCGKKEALSAWVRTFSTPQDAAAGEGDPLFAAFFGQTGGILKLGTCYGCHGMFQPAWTDEERAFLEKMRERKLGEAKKE